MLILKTIIRAIVIIGLLLSLFELLGCFKDRERMSFYKTLKNELEIKLEHPGAKKFIKDFIKDTDYSNEDFSKIEKITLRAFGLGHANDDNKNATQMIAGHVILKRIDGKVSRNICSIDELRMWSDQSPFWRWLSWIILATGVVLETIIFLFNEFFKKHS